MRRHLDPPGRRRARGGAQSAARVRGADGARIRLVRAERHAGRSGGRRGLRRASYGEGTDGTRHMISLKSARELELMEQGGRILGATLDHLRAAVRPGISTGELDAIAEEFI